MVDDRMPSDVPDAQPPAAEGDRVRARAALAWAADVATTGAAGKPARPTLADMRALPLAEFRGEMDRLLLGRDTQGGLDALAEIGALDVWMPEVAGLIGFGDGEWRHKDVWKHTKQVVAQSVPRLSVRWSALLHDIGKPRTRTFGAGGEVHFFGHSEVGAAMFRKRVAQRLGFAGDAYDRVHYLILHHLRASQYDGSWTDSAVRRFAKEMGDGLKDLLDLSRADITTKRPERRRRGLRQIAELANRIREIEEIDARVPPLPKGIGDALMEALGIPPSRALGVIKRHLEDAAEAGEIAPHRDSAYYVDLVRKDPTRFGVDASIVEHVATDPRDEHLDHAHTSAGECDHDHDDE